jgi:hypothetical protein
LTISVAGFLEGDLGYWAVSDASPDEFSKFEHAFATGG